MAQTKKTKQGNTTVDKMQKQALDLWKKTVGQLDEISKSLKKAVPFDRLHFDRAKLMEERDKLFKRLGEETYKLIERGKVSVPKQAQDLYKRIQDLMDKIKFDKKPKKSAKKKTAKKSTKKTTTKSKKKPAKKSAAKKTTSKQ